MNLKNDSLNVNTFCNYMSFEKVNCYKLQEGQVGLSETKLLFDDIQVCVPWAIHISSPE